MTRINIWTAITVSSGLLAACTSSDEGPPYNFNVAGSTGTGGQGGSEPAGKDSGTSGTSGANGEASTPGDPECPRDAYRYDGGPCTCLPSIPNVCPGTVNGAARQICVDTKADPDNCGGCGVVCDASVGCNAGKCGTKATQLASAGAGCGSLKITIAGGKIYWADKGHGTIDSMPTAGGTPTQLAMGEMAPLGIVVNTGNVYSINSANQTIRKIAPGDAAAKTLATGAASAAGPGIINAITVSADGGSLYYAQDECIYKIATAGSTATKGCAAPDAGKACATINGSACVGSSEPGSHGIPTALAVDANNVYYPTDRSGNVEIMSLTTGVEFKVAESQGGLLFDTIQVSGDHLYWANEGSVSLNVTFLQGPSAGINTISVGQTTAGHVSAFAVGPTSVYAAEDGFVSKSPPIPDGGDLTSVILARNVPPAASDDAGNKPAMPSSLALDGTNVYWTTGDCKIMVLADSAQ